VPSSPEVLGLVLDVISSLETTYGSTANNITIDEATDLPADVVDHALEELWRRGEIEGVPTFGCGRHPTLAGVRRVLPERGRMWGIDGMYTELPN
jgi:hypothetical protein